MPLNIATDTIGSPERSSFRLPFKEQEAFFNQKLNLPTEKWDDILGAAHDRAFIVAGAAKADLLTDLRNAVTKAVTEGRGLDWFRGQFDGIVAKHGWSYKGGRDWRTNVIYQTNILSSYAAGRYAQLTDPDLLQKRPFWKYVHNDTVRHPRPLHQAWGNKPVVLRHDDPWWRSHFPPCGWLCHCRVTAVRADQYKGDPAPDDGTYEHIDGQGVIHTLPAGVDYGWNYTPGRTWQPQIDKYPNPIAKALVADYANDGVLVRWHGRLEKSLEQWRQRPEFSGLKGDALVSALRKANLIPFEQLVVGVISAEVKAMLASNSQALLLSADTVVKQLIKREGQAVDAATYAILQNILDKAQVVKVEGENKVAYWRQDGKIWFAVIKTTKDGGENYLLSLRQTNIKDARKNLTADELKRLGVA